MVLCVGSLGAQFASHDPAGRAQQHEWRDKGTWAGDQGGGGSGGAGQSDHAGQHQPHWKDIGGGYGFLFKF